MDIEIRNVGHHRTPVLAGTARPVGQIVHACHEHTIDMALAELGITGLDRAGLDRLLTYCAETRCEADQASCPGCKRRTDLDGVHSLEDFIARHGEIVVGDGKVRLLGQGRERLTTPGLAALEKTWSGQNYWFWARRVLRKLRHGIRRTHMKGSRMADPGLTPTVILVEPQLPDNIGMVARACANFGLDDLRLVAPRDGWPNDKARIAASGANYVIDDATAYGTFEEALGDLNWVCATTARQRDLRKPVMTPEEAVQDMRRRIADGQRCGAVFGRERSGLETSEVAQCDAIVMIPVNNRFASLNLAQAVLILGYEWMRESKEQSLGRTTTYETPAARGLNMGDQRPATHAELEGFFAHLERELDRLGFFTAPHKRPAVVNNLRSMFLRAGLTDQEVRTLRGIVATLANGKGRSRKPST